MITSLTPNAQAERESQWIELRTRLDSIASLLRTQGVLDRKHQKGRWVWRVRYTDKVNARRRTIYIGTDPELARRVQELLNHYREQQRWAEQTEVLVKLALYGGVRFGRGCLTPSRRRRAAHTAKANGQASLGKQRR